MTDPFDLTEDLAVNSDEQRRSQAVLHEFELSWKAGERPALENCLQGVDVAQREQLARRLLALEIRLRAESCTLPELRTALAQAVPLLHEASRATDLGVDDTKDDATIDHSAKSAPMESLRLKSPRSKSAVGDFGDYQLLQEIARGGMGVVFKARQVSLNRTVALKMILAGQLASHQEVQRFRAEAEAAAKLEHPGIVPIYEIGEREGRHFFSMAFVDGKSLSARIAESPLPPREAADLIRKIALAVAFANENGVIHRDLKPGNVLLDQQGEPRVTDFGLAKAVDGDSELTATGQILGTPSYMPPEQALGKSNEVDRRSDVYALGAILYSALSGHPPHQAAHPMDTIKAVVELEPVALRAFNAGIPRDLETICLKALSKEKERRYDTATDLAADLERFLANEPIVARPVGRIEKAQLWCKRNPKTVLTAGILFVVLFVSGMAAWSWRAQGQALSLMEGLLAADPEGVTEIAEQLAGYQSWIQPRLEAIVRSPALTDLQKRQQLHAKLALAAMSDFEMDDLQNELLRADLPYAGPIVKAFELHPDRVDQPGLWTRFHDPAGDPEDRFRAGLALASLQPNSDQWSDTDWTILTRQLVAANPVYHKQVWKLLENVGTRLTPSLEGVFRDESQKENRRIGAANALAHFIGSDQSQVIRLMLASEPEQYNILKQQLEDPLDEVALERLQELARRPPEEGLSPGGRILLGKQRADAAITLMQRGDEDAVFSTMRVDDDQESLTQFVHRCRARGVTSQQLLDSLLKNEQRRQEKIGDERRIADRVHFGLLLALGEFSLDQIPKQSQDALVDQIANWYASDPSSAIHGAAGWLLRHWDRAELAQKVDQTPQPYSIDREWFTLEVKTKVEGLLGPIDSAFYYTFVVFAAGDYEIGSPEDEPNRRPGEDRHPVEITRPFAMLDRELTVEEMITFDDNFEFLAKKYLENDRLRATVGVRWYDAVNFCRWLGAQMGLAEDDQAYVDPETLGAEEFQPDPLPAANGAPLNWPLRWDRIGFRLPTEAEWEIACRGGTHGSYGHGGDPDLLEHYAWFMGNSGSHGAFRPKSGPRPNARGLFDMQGNVSEWCHDWSRLYDEMATDPSGPRTGTDRVHRGGRFVVPASSCRSAYRYGESPITRSVTLGFRLALSLPTADPQQAFNK